MTREVLTFGDLQHLSDAVAREIVAIAKESVSTRGRFTLALAGGSTPKGTYELLATRHAAEIDWGRTIVVFGDERFVPADDPRSNYMMARETLLARVPIPVANVIAVPTDSPTPADAAGRYEAILRRELIRSGSPRHDETYTVDVALLGVGPDGHTASLFPESPELDERSRWVLPVKAPTHGV